jgi:hypothetical protein
MHCTGRCRRRGDIPKDPPDDNRPLSAAVVIRGAMVSPGARRSNPFIDRNRPDLARGQEPARAREPGPLSGAYRGSGNGH